MRIEVLHNKGFKLSTIYELSDHAVLPLADRNRREKFKALPSKGYREMWPHFTRISAQRHILRSWYKASPFKEKKQINNIEERTRSANLQHGDWICSLTKSIPRRQSIDFESSFFIVEVKLATCYLSAKRGTCYL